MGQDKERPHFPANLVGDFGGGSTYLVIGVLAALLEARLSGEGQVVDAAIVDGTANLNAMTSGYLAGGNMREERAANLLDGGMPFYDLYETSDGRHMSVGPLEPQFYDEFVKRLGIESAPDRYDFEQLDELRRLITEAFAARTQAEWTEVFEGTDACVAPVLTLSEAAEHPHMAAREVFVENEGVRPAGSCSALLPYDGQPLLAPAPQGRRRHQGGARGLGHPGSRRTDRAGRRRPGLSPDQGPPPGG